MDVRDFVFQAPRMAIFLLVALFIIWCFRRLYYYRKKILSSFSGLYTQMMVPRSRSRYLSKVVLITLAWIFAAFALMEPAGNARYPPGFQNALKGTTSATNQQNNQDVIFLIDASSSMSVFDGRSGKSRLEFSKEISEEIINALSGQNVSVYAFTSQGEPLVPSTLDYLFARLVIRGIVINDPGVSGTSIVNAFKGLVTNLTERPTATKKTVILLSDGGDTELEKMSSPNRVRAIDTTLQSLKNIPGGEIQIYSIGVGTKGGGKIPNLVYEGTTVQSALDEGILKSLSQGTRGQYFYANNYSAYSLAKEIITDFKEAKSYESELSDRNSKKTTVTASNIPLIYDLYFQIPLGIALILLGLYWLLPDVLRSEAQSKDA